MTCQGEYYLHPPIDHVFRYAWALKKLGGVGNGRAVLDVGCGSGYGVKMFVVEGFDCYGMDRNSKAIEQAQWSVGDRVFTSDWPPPMRKDWAAILMIEMIEHNDDGIRLFEEAARLAPRVLATVPYNDSGKQYHKLQNLTEDSFNHVPGVTFMRQYGHTSLFIDYRRPDETS